MKTTESVGRALPGLDLPRRPRASNRPCSFGLGHDGAMGHGKRIRESGTETVVLPTSLRA
jgi:hypothetical protein